MNTAAGSVQQTGTAARVNIKLLGDAPGDISYGEDGDSIVRRAYIGKSNEGTDAPFRSLARTDTPRDTVDDKLHSSVMTDEGKDTTGKHGDENEFAHAHHAREGTVNPSHEGVTAVQYAGETCERTAESQDYQHIDPESGGDQDCQIREDLEER